MTLRFGLWLLIPGVAPASVHFLSALAPVSLTQFTAPSVRVGGFCPSSYGLDYRPSMLDLKCPSSSIYVVSYLMLRCLVFSPSRSVLSQGSMRSEYSMIRTAR